MTHQRSRLRRVVKWAGLAICLLMILVFGAAEFRSFGYKGDTWFVASWRGSLATGWCSQWPGWSAGEGWFINTPWPDHLDIFIAPLVKPVSTGGNIFLVPHGLLLPVVALATAFVWWRDRPPPKGHCQSCGYELTGNVSGVCPECGDQIPERTRRRMGDGR